ncbi:MAG: alanine--tRNA ligase-related protein, partial [Planctomycetota bacterium]
SYPEVVRHRHTVEIAICAEEERFREIYRRGRTFLDTHIERAKAAGTNVFPGSDAFELHDTYGFPSDLTRVIVEEEGLRYDEAGFERAMEEQRRRAQAKSTIKGEVFDTGPVSQLKAVKQVRTEFVGYEKDEVDATLWAVFRGEEKVHHAKAGEEVDFVLDRTPFYAESGGQVADRGLARMKEKGEDADSTAEVLDVQNRDGFYFHRVRVTQGAFHFGATVGLRVDPGWRWRVTKNHTATHLLHKALKVVLGPSVGQAGSLVHPEYLRFDFTWGEKLTEDQKRSVEDLVNRRVMEAIPVTWDVKPLEEAKAEGAVMMFGEKYGERVRVLRVGDFSVELCGGTHAANSGNIGPFRITKEQALGAGVRRIFALTGPGAIEHLRGREEALEEAARSLKTPP